MENANFPDYLTEHNDFDCGLFRLPNLDTLILTAMFAFEMGFTAGETSHLLHVGT
jgi:hypothetical protein